MATVISVFLLDMIFSLFVKNEINNVKQKLMIFIIYLISETVELITSYAAMTFASLRVSIESQWVSKNITDLETREYTLSNNVLERMIAA